MVDAAKVEAFVNESWDKDVFPVLEEYIGIPNVSPEFDPEIYTNGYQEQVLKLMTDWVKKHPVKGMTMDVCEEKEKTPFIFIEVEKSAGCKTDETILLYGHMDKQPPMTEDWDTERGLHPYKAKILDGKMYGRGGADDGYAIFAAMDSIRALQDQGAEHPRCVITIEASEESGSPDLDGYLDQFKDRIGVPSVVVCLDSGCGGYDQMWITSSLRGYLCCSLSASLLTEGVHSGGSGIIRSSFHVVRALMDRFDDAATGICKVKELCPDIPERDRKYAADYAALMGPKVWEIFPLHDGCEPQLPPSEENAAEMVLNKTWRPQLSVTGQSGIPGMTGGNVLRPETKLKFSIRLPPTVDPNEAYKALKAIFEADPPFKAKVNFEMIGGGGGFSAPELSPWLSEAVQSASQAYYEKPCMFFGEGGSIPLMGNLRRNFPDSQFVVTGVLGPGSNAHGPNEFIHMGFTKKLVCCVSSILNSAALHD